ncbi:MAG: fibronectin type III domain-containing protein [Usitatibacter sp.]
MRQRTGFVAILVVASMIALFGARGIAGAEMRAPTVAPLSDRVYTFDGLEKYQLFFPPNGAMHAAGVMHWRYNDANRPAGIAMATAIGQVQASMAKWTAVCRISFVYDGTTTAGFSSADGINVVGWDPTGLTAPTTGITTIAAGGGTIVDADIRLNAAYSATYSPSLDPTATHEVGHALGLDHSDVSAQVMSGPPLTNYSGETTPRVDDIAGCVKLYGTPGSSGPDSQAPSVPTNLVATAVSTTGINLTWTASTDNVGVTNYKVFQGGTQLGTVTGMGASVSGLAAATMYSFTVSACDASSNCSAQSAAATATTLADTQAPTIPTGLTATPVSVSQVNLAWTASTDNIAVINYRVFQGGAFLGTTSATLVSVNGLSAGTTYAFTVSACDAAANCSGQSAPASATTLAASTPACAGPQPPDDRQTLSCPAGQAGSIVQSRSYSCVGTAWMPGIYQTISNSCFNGAAQNYQDLWWSPGENGWGLTITQHRDVLFIAWYVYDASGKPVWVVMSSGQWDATHTTYTGDVYIPSGTWFGNYDGNRFIVGAPAGTASLTFTGNATATLTYNINGLTGTKPIARLLFGPVNNAPVASYGDTWWAGALENGWGLILSQQYQTIFATWYTYDPAGQTTWFVMSGGSWTSANTYSGQLYRTRGAQVLGAAYNQSAFTVTQVGTLTLTFTDADHATMAYTVDGLTQTKPIARLGF